LKVEREGEIYRFKAPVATGKLIAGAVLPTLDSSPTGGLPEWTREIPGEVPAVGAGQAA
jgi:hypothetical protein